MTGAVTIQDPPRLVLRTLNPIMRSVLRSPLHPAVDKTVILLHITGRRTGRRYAIPVGRRNVDGQLAAFTHAPWRLNLRGGADIDVTHDGRREAMRAELVEDPASVAAVFDDQLRELGWRKASRLGLKVHVDRAPTRAELQESLANAHVSIAMLAPRG
jgi:hypothetical protein